MSTNLLKLVGCAVFGLSAGLFAIGFLTAALPAEPILGPRGKKRQEALATRWFRRMEPALRFAGARMSSLLPQRALGSVDDALTRAGDPFGLTPGELVLVTVVAPRGGGALGKLGTMMHLAPILCLVVPGLVALAPCVWLFELGAHRATELRHGLPYASDILSLSMTAGMDFPAALRQVAERSSDRILVEEAELMLHGLALGQTRKQVLLEFSRRTQVEAVRELVAAIVQSEERGVPLVDTLSIQSHVQRHDRSMRGEQAAASSESALYVPLAMMLGAIMLILITPLFLRIQMGMK
jgi:tight adherence protein C